MRRAALCLLLVGCGSVELGEEERAQDLDMTGDAGTTPPLDDAATGMVGSSDAGPPPEVVVRIKPLDCGTCFELQADASGGRPPYGFQWEDGSFRAQRSVCVDGTVALSVIAFDSAAGRSSRQVIHLESASDANCPELIEPPDAAVPAVLCLDNPSFEGTPAVNIGDSTTFDAAPWSACTNPVQTNTPDIANQSVAVTDVPPPADGLTYLALGEGEQVSQELCSELMGGAPVYLQLDLARIEYAGDPEQIFLDIYGGLSANCSQSELLWSSSTLQTSWQQLCVTLQPAALTTQLTLRARADMTSLNPAYLLVDNLQPVDACP